MLKKKKSYKSKTEFFKEYNKYLKSNDWKMRKKEFIRMADYKCETCEEEDKILHVHHLHYRSLGNESFEDVLVLCISCHERLHGRKFRRNMI